MAGDRQQMWAQAWRHARTFLGRWSDPITRAEREDLAQEAAFLAGRQIDRVRDRTAFPALVRTIARRVRSKVLHARGRDSWRAEPDAVMEHLPTSGRRDHYVVCGVAVDRLWLLVQLDAVLGQLEDVNRRILLGFYEGFCCAELGQRYRLPAAVVKVRLYRLRRTVQQHLEAKVRAAGCLEVSMHLDNEEGCR